MLQWYKHLKINRLKSELESIELKQQSGYILDDYDTEERDDMQSELDELQVDE